MRRLLIAGMLFASVRSATAQDPTPPPPAPDAPDPSPPTDPNATEASPTGVAQPSPPTPPAPPAVPLTDAEKKAAAAAARLAAVKACTDRAPECDWIATLSSLERQSVKRGIEARGYVLEPSPWGKTIGKVHIYNEDVFAEKNRWLRLLNFFHYTTRETTIRKDLVVEEGQVYSQEIVEETARHLRDPAFSSVIAIVPVRGSAGAVDLLVVTRDIWSLRLNTQYTFQSGSLTNLSTSLSENNFLGFRTLVAATLLMDQGAIATGPLLLDKNVLGKHVELRAAFSTIVNRDKFFDGDWESEGSSSSVRLTRSLWRLSEKWGASISFSHRFAIERNYAGLDLRPVYCPPGAGECAVPTRAETAELSPSELFGLRYRNRSFGLSTSLTRQWGQRLKQQVSFGWNVDKVRYVVRDNEVIARDGTVAAPDQVAAFVDTILPPSETNSAPYVSYGFFQPRYKTRRNVGTYDLAEDLRLGVDFEVSYGLGLEAFGSTNTFQRGGVSLGYTLPWADDASARLSTSYSTRVQGSDFVDNASSVNARVVTPSYGGYGRIVAEGQFSTRWDDRVSSRAYYIGSDNGLRGYGINEFFGKRLVSTQLEFRSTPVPVWVVRAGAVLFYDAGSAADTVGEFKLHHDVGLGLRALVPQTSRELFRFDLAFPLEGENPGIPRFIAGFQSEF